MAQSYEASLPSYLNINSNPFFNPSSPQAQGYISNQANAYYNQAYAPQVAQIATNNYQTGMNNSSSGGAELGQATAEGEGLANLYGTQAYESLLSGMNNTSANYFQGPGQMATQNLGASNQYQQQGYTTASENYRQQLAAGASLGGSLLTGGLSGAIGSASSSALGGKGGGGGGYGTGGGVFPVGIPGGSLTTIGG